MRVINQEELNIILKNHKLWLEREGGKRADLSDTKLNNVDLRYANLRQADLSYSNLRCADLAYTDLRDANLKHTDLEGAYLRESKLNNANLNQANLKCADLENADLRDADFSFACLEHANLRYADLSDADSRGANLSDADLKHTDLSDANLSDANLKDVKTNIYTVGYHLACPEEGSFVGYKKADDCIVKLLILEDAKRSSATTIKCRCNKAKVLEITDIETGKSVDSAYSDYDNDFIYKVGEVVYVDNFDNDRWNECSNGIHFFLNKENAIKY